MSDKIIHSFQQRRQLAQAIDDLAQTRSEAELLAQVRNMVHNFPPDLLMGQLIKLLDTPNSQLRGGLGHLAALLPPEEVVPALRSAAANRGNPPQTRITAALILERFLGESLPPALLGDLNQSNEVAFQSLLEAVEEGAHNRHVLLEYVTQMRDTNEATAMMVMQLMERLAPGQQLALYRLIAQDDRPNVARTALARLEQLVSQTPARSGLACLHALQAMLPPEGAAQVERTLRKLAFAGHRYVPPAPEHWRALCSPADIGGNYTIWFVYTPPLESDTGEMAPDAPHNDDQDDQGVLLGLVLNAERGVLQAYGSEIIPRDQLPPQRAVGELVPVRTDGGGQATLLEIPFDFGRLRLAQAQAAHFQQPDPQPLPGEYRLYGDRIWAFTPPQADPALERYFDDEVGNEKLDREKLDSEAVAADIDLEQATQHLLSHPALAAWRSQNRIFIQGLGARNAALRDLPAHELAAIVLRELDQRPERTQLTNALSHALRLQAAWLHIAGDQESARRAHALATVTPRLPIPQNPLLARLVEAALTI